jgi:hypothetical protein
MPVFINEVVFRGDLQGSRETRDAAPGGGNAGDPAGRQALIDEVTQAVLDYLERELERMGER